MNLSFQHASHRKLLRWVLPALAVIAGCFFLTDAFFSAWNAGGLPGEHKVGRERRSLGSLSLSLACFALVAFLFRAVMRLPRPGLLAWLLAAIAVVLALAPFVAREVIVDSCLDSGGRWNQVTVECEH
jgi:peptidoglycan/LPS O-acetylase OafA/YrhL